MSVERAPFKSDPGSHEKLLLFGSGVKTGQWFPVDPFKQISFQCYAQSGTSGTAAGTFSGTVEIDISLTSDSRATPRTVLVFPSATMDRIVDFRSQFVRAKVPAWAGHNYVVLMKAYL